MPPNIRNTRSMLPDISNMSMSEITVDSFPVVVCFAVHMYPTTQKQSLPMASLQQQMNYACIRVWILGGANIGRGRYPIYCEIDFRDELPDHTPALIAQAATSSQHTPEFLYWNEAFGACHQDLLRLGAAAVADRKLNNLPPENRVFVPTELAHPSGPFFVSLSKEQAKLAFFVARHGFKNSIMCRNCIQLWTGSYSMAKEHILHPFHNCISLRGINRNACANCIWHGNSNCDWTLFPGYSPVAADQGNLLRPLGGQNAPNIPFYSCPDYLDNKHVPRLSCDPFPLIVSPQHDDHQQRNENHNDKSIISMNKIKGF